MSNCWPSELNIRLKQHTHENAEVLSELNANAPHKFACKNTSVCSRSLFQLIDASPYSCCHKCWCDGVFTPKKVFLGMLVQLVQYCHNPVKWPTCTWSWNN